MRTNVYECIACLYNMHVENMQCMHSATSQGYNQNGNHDQQCWDYSLIRIHQTNNDANNHSRDMNQISPVTAGKQNQLPEKVPFSLQDV